MARAIKIAALVIGGPLAILGCMAIAGAFVESGLARLAIAVVVVIGVPALIADRVLPDDPDRGRGIASDVFAVSWLGFAFAVFGIGTGATRSVLQTEAHRLHDAGYERLASATDWLVGADSGAAAGPAAGIAEADRPTTGEATAATEDAGPIALDAGTA